MEDQLNLNLNPRKLASVQIITGIEPIEEKDFIEYASVLGWNCVVKKNEFNVGDLCVYCEIDSILPEKEEFEFLRPRKFRIKTSRIGGQISQGICFPINILPEGNYSEGDDVTDIIGVVKYDPELRTPNGCSCGGKVRGSFPSDIPKTDETRVQSIPKIIEELRGVECYTTEKLDGTSFTSYIKDGYTGYCSRNNEYDDSEENKNNYYYRAYKKFDIEEKLKSLGGRIAIQGEIIGPGIQKNKYQLKDIDLYIYNLYNIESGCYIGFDTMISILNKIDLKMVPVIDNPLFLDDYDVPKLVSKSIDYSVLNKDTLREGLVIRPKIEKWHKKFGRMSFKVINPEFLLKYGE